MEILDFLSFSGILIVELCIVSSLIIPCLYSTFRKPPPPVLPEDFSETVKTIQDKLSSNVTFDTLIESSIQLREGIKDLQICPMKRQLIEALFGSLDVLAANYNKMMIEDEH